MTTPKQQVLKRYRRAYAANAGGSWFIYEPRGYVGTVLTIGIGDTASQAWADCLRRMLARSKTKAE